MPRSLRWKLLQLLVSDMAAVTLQFSDPPEVNIGPTRLSKHADIVLRVGNLRRPCQVGEKWKHFFRKPPTSHNKFCLHNAPRTELAMSCVEVVLWTPPMDSKGAAGEILPKLSKLLPWKFSCCGWNHVLGCFPTEKSVGLFFIPPKNVIPIFFWKNRGLTFPLL